jgi:transposase
VSFELADKTWKLSLSDGRRGPSRYIVDAGDTFAVLECLTKARTRCGLSAQCKVHTCYEVGRDGWWLHRWLIEQGFLRPADALMVVNAGETGTMP